MKFKDFSKKELEDMLELIQSSITCRTGDEFLGMLTRLKEMVSAETAISVIGETTSGSIIKILNLDYPQEWQCIYTTEELYKDDPVFLFNFKHNKTHFWHEAMQAFPNSRSLNVMNRAADFGLKHGVTSGIIEKQNIGSIFSFASREDKFKDREKRLVDIMTPYLHQSLIRLYQKTWSLTIYNISQRETEVLKWLKEGKTNWEISVILGISERTVKFHIHNIIAKLNAVSKSHALAIALNCGLI